MGTNASDAPHSQVIVIGAGPAGMLSAISATIAGARVTIVEHLDRPGVKLLATGGGRCNLTNTLDTETFMHSFGKNGRFMQPALEEMSASRLRSFFADHNVPTVSPDGFHVYPLSNSAVSIQQALKQCCASLGVNFLLGTEAASLVIRESSLAGVTTSAGELPAASVILATGGRSYPDLGATGSGYALAVQAGHTIVEPLPVLVPLFTRETWPRELSGVSLQGVHAQIDLPRLRTDGCTGDLLFTRTGVSGPVILDLSREAVPLLREHGEVPLRINLEPATSPAVWNSRFENWSSAHGRKSVFRLLDQHLPSSLARIILRIADVSEETTAAGFRRSQRDAVLERLTKLPLAVTGAGGFDNAMVTRGGIRLREVDPKTLQSRITRGLFFAGEILDLDGPCGGYNLQWAFSSGWLAGRSAAGK